MHYLKPIRPNFFSARSNFDIFFQNKWNVEHVYLQQDEDEEEQEATPKASKINSNIMGRLFNLITL